MVFIAGLRMGCGNGAAGSIVGLTELDMHGTGEIMDFRDILMGMLCQDCCSSTAYWNYDSSLLFELRRTCLFGHGGP